MILGTLVLVLGLMLAFPRTPFARQLHHDLVERAVRWLDRQTPLGLMKNSALFLIGVAILLVAPEVMMVAIAMGEPALAIEIGLMLLAAQAAGAFRSMRRAAALALSPAILLARVLMRFAPSPRAPRRPRRRPGAGTRSDDPEPVFGFAFRPAPAPAFA